MKKITIKQIFIDTDLRSGEVSLGNRVRRESLANHEVYLFMNRPRNIIKVLGRRGMYIDRLPGRQTFDFRLRRELVLQAIGNYFGITFDIPAGVYKDVQREAGITKTKGGDKYGNPSIQGGRTGHSTARV